MPSSIVSRIGPQARTTLPRAVRDALGLAPGDLLSWRIVGDRAVVQRMPEEPFAAFDDWTTEADSIAYAGL